MSKNSGGRWWDCEMGYGLWLECERVGVYLRRWLRGAGIENGNGKCDMGMGNGVSNAKFYLHLRCALSCNHSRPLSSSHTQVCNSTRRAHNTTTPSTSLYFCVHLYLYYQHSLHCQYYCISLVHHSTIILPLNTSNRHIPRP